jgi:probable HAF family extracellular repeat protein
MNKKTFDDTTKPCRQAPYIFRKRPIAIAVISLLSLSLTSGIAQAMKIADPNLVPDPDVPIQDTGNVPTPTPVPVPVPVTGTNADVAYTVTDLGSFERGGYSEAHGTNPNAQVVGYSWLTVGDLVAGEKQFHAFSSQAGVMTDLGTLGGSNSEADAVNAGGQIVGKAFLSGNQAYHAFLAQNGQMVDLGTLGGTNSEAHGINAHGINADGMVVGTSSLTGDTVEHAFIVKNGAMTDQGTLGGSTSEAIGINDTGQVIGNSWTTGDETQHAFISTNGVMTDLGTLDGNWSEAHGINANGEVVGLATTYNEMQQHAFVYRDGHMLDLGTLGGGFSKAEAINGYSQIVGSTTIALTGEEHAFVTQYGFMIDLNNLIDSNSGWTLTEATGINDEGEIVGAGYNATGQYHAYLATPVYTAAPTVSIQQSALDITITGSGFVNATATATITGGQAPLKCHWTVSGAGGAFSVSSPFDTSTEIKANVLAGESVSGLATVTVTDARGRTSQATVPVNFTAELPAGKSAL